MKTLIVVIALFAVACSITNSSNDPCDVNNPNIRTHQGTYIDGKLHFWEPNHHTLDITYWDVELKEEHMYRVRYFKGDGMWCLVDIHELKWN